MGRGNSTSFTNNDISSFMTCNRVLDNTTGNKGGTGTDYPGPHEFALIVYWGSCCSIFSFLCSVLQAMACPFSLLFLPFLSVFPCIPSEYIFSKHFLLLNHGIKNIMISLYMCKSHTHWYISIILNAVGKVVRIGRVLDDIDNDNKLCMAFQFRLTRIHIYYLWLFFTETIAQTSNSQNNINTDVVLKLGHLKKIYPFLKWHWSLVRSLFSFLYHRPGLRWVVRLVSYKKYELVSFY